MKICIDPGHGMSNRKPGLYDPGAIVPGNNFGLTEADIVLSYAHSLNDKFQAAEIETWLTRRNKTDYAPVFKRAKMAENEKCDLLISLHCNSSADQKAHGFEVFFQNKQSQRLAESLAEMVTHSANLRNRGAKWSDNLAVLNFKRQAVLIELGFISNHEDFNKIIVNREVITNSIYQVVSDLL